MLFSFFKLNMHSIVDRVMINGLIIGYFQQPGRKLILKPVSYFDERLKLETSITLSAFRFLTIFITKFRFQCYVLDVEMLECVLQIVFNAADLLFVLPVVNYQMRCHRIFSCAHRPYMNMMKAFYSINFQCFIFYFIQVNIFRNGI